ncbi:hypothetical protein Bca52824_058323 [Brassica carinata]|uniref:Uncharacterized protein n=1 Tax=Brassica carinata TaxID=52824 RepID=A0A8X7QSK7_BRACI|nr:hypothetical protein Bca52824_058323 [Brassica carinata]
MDSPVSRSDSSSEPGSPVPLPLSCVYVAPPLVGPASLVGGDELAEWRAGTHPAPAEGERAVLRARQLPVDRRQVNFLEICQEALPVILLQPIRKRRR